MEQNQCRTYSLATHPLYNEQQTTRFVIQVRQIGCMPHVVVSVVDMCITAHLMKLWSGSVQDVDNYRDFHASGISPACYPLPPLLISPRVVISVVIHMLCTRCPWLNGQLYTYPRRPRPRRHPARCHNPDRKLKSRARRECAASCAAGVPGAYT